MAEKGYRLTGQAAAGSDEPRVLGGVPGVWLPGRPLSLTTLGFADQDSAEAHPGLAAAVAQGLLEPVTLKASEEGTVPGFALTSPAAAAAGPVEQVQTADGRRVEVHTGPDGERIVVEREPGAAPPAAAETTPDALTGVRTHADADAVAAELGVVFADDVKTVDEKLEVLRTVTGGDER